VQSESIVYSIQSLLAAIRRGAQVHELNENLTQIITIVTSIVAVCKDSLPAASVQLGTEILHDLSENCNKLGEMQSLSEITKTTRQAMASSSFGVAKAMKELMKL
jgi:protein SPA2